jgi:hypothetical protein
VLFPIHCFFFAVALAEYTNVVFDHLLLLVLLDDGGVVYAELKHFRLENIIVELLPASKAPFTVWVDNAVLQ